MKTMEKKEINERNNMLFSEVEPSCQMSMAFWDGEPYVRLFSEKRRFSFMIPLKEIDSHLQAVQKNLDLYLSMKNQVGLLPFSIKTFHGFTLWFNAKNAGVCLNESFRLLSSEEEFQAYERNIRNLQHLMKATV